MASDRVPVDRVRDEEQVGPVHRDRPERLDRREVAAGEVHDVTIGTAQGGSGRVPARVCVHGLGRHVRTPARLGDRGAQRRVVSVRADVQVDRPAVDGARRLPGLRGDPVGADAHAREERGAHARVTHFGAGMATRADPEVREAFERPPLHRIGRRIDRQRVPELIEESDAGRGDRLRECRPERPNAGGAGAGGAPVIVESGSKRDVGARARAPARRRLRQSRGSDPAAAVGVSATRVG